MALLNNETGEYYKVELPSDLSTFDLNIINFKVYEDLVHRLNGDTKYKKAQDFTLKCYVNGEVLRNLINFLYVEEKDDIDNIKTCLYKIAKTKQFFSGFEDEIGTYS